MPKEEQRISKIAKDPIESHVIRWNPTEDLKLFLSTPCSWDGAISSDPLEQGSAHLMGHL